LAQEDHTVAHHWQLRVERARYEAERAARQYQAVEPEHRLVARTLEQHWEQALRAVEQVEQEYARWRHQQQRPVTDADQRAILALGADFPALWAAPTTLPADRKRLLRLVIRDVNLDRHRARGQVWLQINWHTGASSEHWLRRTVLGYAQHADLGRLQQRVQDLHAAGQVDTAIAATLNAEGFQTAHGRPFNGRAVWYLRQAWGLPPVATAVTPAVTTGERVCSAVEAAALIGAGLTTIYKWLQNGRLRGVQVKAGLPWHVVLDPETVATSRAYLDRARRVKRSKKEAV
jgi:excisionase family DNA binding protein